MALSDFLRNPSSHRDELNGLLAEFEALEKQDTVRVQRMKQYRDEGNRVRDPNLQISSSDLRDYGRRPRTEDQPQRHRIPLPLGKAATVKHAYRIAGRLPDVIVDERDESPEERYRSDAMEKIVWAVIRASQGDTTFASASWNGSELGAACFDIYMDYKQNIARFRSIDPLGLYVVPGVDNPHEFSRIYRTWLSPKASVQNDYRNATFRGERVRVEEISGSPGEGGAEMVQLVQLCDTEKKVRFAMGGNGAVGLFEEEHGLGFVPYVVIPNLGPYEELWGWADYEFIRAVTQYMTLLFSREADVLKSVAAGAYIETGTGQAGSVISKVIREGGVIASKREGKVEPVEAADMPTFASEHAQRGMDLFKMLGFVPDASWGLPGSGSGTDRGLQLQPLLEYTAMKQLNWQAGLSRLFELCYRMIEQKMVGTSTYRGTKVSGKARRRTAFSLILGPTEEPAELQVDSNDPMAAVQTVTVPRSPKELFDGDYGVRFTWRNMVDPDDPAYVLSELNKFQSGAQSLQTTLENLGFQAPEEEMRKIEKEAERFPWINQGLVSLLMAQFRGNAQGSGGGAPADTLGALGGVLGSLTGGAAGGAASGALDADAGAAALGGMGQLYGGA